MKSRVSELMDGELQGREAGVPLEALQSEGEAREAWRTYHLISDALRDTRMVSESFAARVAARLSGEPTVLAPQRRAAAPRATRFALPVAASLAAMALVGWFVVQPQPVPVPAPVVAVPAPAAKVAARPAPRVAPPAAANDYLLAHQAYSPRNSLQGMAPYARTVSAAAERGKP